MKILHTIANYSPENGGGATEVVKQISNQLAMRGHSVTVATAYSERRDVFEVDGVKVKQFNISGRLKQSILGIAGDPVPYLDEVRHGGYDVVMNYAAQTWHVDLLLPLLEKVKAVKVLCACGFSGLLGWRKWLYKRYYRRLSRRLHGYDSVVCHSGKYIDAMFVHRFAPDKLVVIPNAVAEVVGQRQNQFRSRHGIVTELMILSVGDHYRNKGHSRVIEAFEASRLTNATLVIIGRDTAGAFRGCSSQCRKAMTRVKNIRIMNCVSREDVLEAFKDADVFVSGSYIEAFPLVILESMAAGMPYISFNAGNVSELPGGIVVSSVTEMANRLRGLCSDPILRRVLGRSGQLAQQEKYNWSIVGAQYEKLYNSLVRKKGRL